MIVNTVPPYIPVRSAERRTVVARLNGEPRESPVLSLRRVHGDANPFGPRMSFSAIGRNTGVLMRRSIDVQARIPQRLSIQQRGDHPVEPRLDARPTDSLRGGWLRNALLLFLPSALFIVLLYAVAAERVVQVDRKVFRVMERADNPVVAIAAHIGRTIGYVVVAFTILFSFWRVKRRDAAAAVPLVGAVGILAAAVLLTLGRCEGWSYDFAGSATALDRLFPDVHSLVAVVACGLSVPSLASSCWGWYRPLMVACALVLIGWVALGWLSTNVVYGTDILGGILLGCVWWRLCLLLDSRGLFRGNDAPRGDERL